MGSIIYVTEPDAIDLHTVERALRGMDSIVVPGTITFTHSTDQAYDTLLIRSASRIDENVKGHFPCLKNVIRIGTGLDNVDLGYCKKEGISVFNASGANADAVSEYIIAMILYTLRRLDRLSEGRVRAWDRFAFRGTSIREHTIGIVGFGNIGRLLYEKLDVFSVPEFLVFDPYVSSSNRMQADNIQFTSLGDVLKRATIVSLNLPLTPETYHLIDGQKLSLMQGGSILINAARGGIVDETAIVTCIDRAGLTYIADTVEGEPAVDERLLKNKSVILTPHIGSLTTFSEREMVRQAINNYVNGTIAKVL